MTYTIYKYTLPPVETWKDNQLALKTLGDPRVLHMARQHGDLCVWVHGEENNENTLRLKVLGTGHVAPHPMHGAKHVATLVENIFVWHFFAGVLN